MRALLCLAILTFALAPLGCKSEPKGMTKDEARDLTTDAEKLLEQASDPDGFSGSPSDLNLSSKYGKQLGDLIKEAQAIDAEFMAFMDSYDPITYFEPANLAKPAMRTEFRGEIAKYRAAVTKYGKDMDGYYGRVRKLSEEMDNRKYPNLNKEISDALHKTLTSYDVMAVSYLALLDHLDVAKPVFDGTDLKFKRAAEQTKYDLLLERIGANEEDAIRFAEDFEATRQAQLEKAKGQIGDMRQKVGG